MTSAPDVTVVTLGAVIVDPVPVCEATGASSGLPLPTPPRSAVIEQDHPFNPLAFATGIEFGSTAAAHLYCSSVRVPAGPTGPRRLE